MIDPVLQKIAEHPDKIPGLDCLWVATPAGIFAGKPVTYWQALEKSADADQESLGDYFNQLKIDRAKIPLDAPTSEEQEEGRPPILFLLNPLFISGGSVSQCDHAVVLLEQVCAWGIGNPPHKKKAA